MVRRTKKKPLTLAPSGDVPNQTKKPTQTPAGAGDIPNQSKPTDKPSGGVTPQGTRDKLPTRGDSTTKTNPAARQPQVISGLPEGVPTVTQSVAEETGRVNLKKPDLLQAAAQRADIAPTPEERKEAFSEFSGSGQLLSDVQGGIAEPLDLRPEPILESIFDMSRADEVRKQQRQFANDVLTGKATKEEILDEVKKLGTGLAIAGAAIGAVLAVPALATAAYTTVARTSVGLNVGKLSGSVKSLGVTVGALFGLGKAFDFEGGEMNVYRASLRSVVEDGERLEAAARNGSPTTDSIELLTEMNEEVKAAEARIKELGVYNLNYRINSKFVEDQIKVRSARKALERRILAVENLAATGTAIVNPEALMFDMQKFE